MGHLNVEIKARCPQQDAIRRLLIEQNADYRGEDHQIDTYFEVQRGRLKLREGNIEKNLIFYEREDSVGAKQSNVVLYPYDGNPALKELLTKAHGVKVVVDKKREIYFIRNVKFHLDDVVGLGKFVEIEAIDREGTIGKDRLNEQCMHYMRLFNIAENDLLSCSYSDLLLAEKK
jgi:predicted adenylyl cyclase CyaB